MGIWGWRILSEGESLGDSGGRISDQVNAIELNEHATIRRHLFQAKDRLKPQKSQHASTSCHSHQRTSLTAHLRLYLYKVDKHCGFIIKFMFFIKKKLPRWKMTEKIMCSCVSRKMSTAPGLWSSFWRDSYLRCNKI